MAILALLSVLIMAGVAYAYVREGLVSAFCGLVNVLVACLLAFHLWPFLARELEGAVQGTFLEQHEDAVALTVVFCLVLGALRLVTVKIINRDVSFPAPVEKAGSVVCGALAGYFVAGFLICVLQTLPWEEDFLGFEVSNDGLSGRLLPPDHTLLKVMHRSHRGAFSTGDEPTNAFVEFEQSFANYRRFSEKRKQAAPPPLIAPATPKAKDAKKDDAKKDEKKVEEKKKEEEKKKDPDFIEG